MAFNREFFSTRMDGCGLNAYERQTIEFAANSDTPLEFLGHVLSLKMPPEKIDLIAAAFSASCGEQEDKQPKAQPERTIGLPFRTF